MKETLIQTRKKFIIIVRLLTAPMPVCLPIIEVRILEMATIISKKYIDLKNFRMSSGDEIE